MLQIDQHVGQFVLDRLKGTDLPAELKPGFGVFDRQIEQVLCSAHLLNRE